MKTPVLSLWILLIAGGGACGQESAPPVQRRDPFLKQGSSPVTPAEEAAPRRLEGIVRLEFISLPALTARQARKRLPSQEALYTWLGEELEKPDTDVKLERMSVVRIAGGQRSKIEENAEYPVATEFDPARIPQEIHLGMAGQVAARPSPETARPASGLPQTVAAAGSAATAPGATPAPVAAGAIPASERPAPWPCTTATWNSFEFRQTGWTAEMELAFRDGGKTVDMTIAAEYVGLTGIHAVVPSGEVTQPSFQTQKTFMQILTPTGKPALAGTMNPPVNTKVPGGNQVGRVWFLFVTVNTGG